MTLERVFPEVVKTQSTESDMERDHDASVSMPVFRFPSVRPASAWWRWLNADPAVDQAYQRTRKGLFQP